MAIDAITNVVCQGGSVKGTAYIGALESLEDNIDMKKIKRVAGTSAGAITACAFALGCNSKRVRELLPTLNFEEVLDDVEGGVSTRGKVLKSVSKQENGKSLFFSKIPAKTVKKTIIKREFEQYGVYEGEYLREWFEKLITEQVSNLTDKKYSGENLTFLELHQLAEEYPGVFRDLFVVGANLSEKKKKVFSYDNEEMKDVIIADAIRISMSIPGLFKAPHLYYKKEGQRVVDTSNDVWTDGGVLDNYSIDCFDDKKYLEPGEAMRESEDGHRRYNPHTLGFRLVAKETKDYHEGTTKENKKSIPNIMSFLSTAYASGSSLQEEKYAHPENKARTVYIDHLGISTLAFNLSEEQKEALITSGKEATDAYFKKCASLDLSPCDETSPEGRSDLSM